MQTKKFGAVAPRKRGEVACHTRAHRRMALCLAWGLLTFTLRGLCATVVQEFYLPMPESQLYQALSTIQTGIGSTQSSIYSIVVTGDGTVVYYDQWEDGYETDISNPTQPNTRIWGDGNDAHGIPPGMAHNPLGLKAGTVITLTNNVPLPRNPGVMLYDARDRLAATKAVVVTHAGWPQNPGPVYAGAVSVLSTIDYGTNYICPVGQDLTNNLFKYVGLFVMAGQNGTQVTIDADGSGPAAPVNVTLNQGESYLVNGGIKKGGSVSASKPVQADLLIGHVGGSYAADWFTLYPVEQWSDTYYTPVSTSANGNPAFVYLYNPNPTNITINYSTQVGAGSVSVTATNGVVRYQMPKGSGASFTSVGGAKFYALCTAGANPSSDTAYNWGFTLLPKGGLTTEADVGWAPGSSDGTQNGSPVWVTAIGPTRVYVDYKGDHLGPLTDPKGNKYDTSYDLAALQSKKIYDPSKDQTGMRVYTLDGTLITAVWGEDPDVAAPGNPFIDAGTTVLPFPVPILTKTSLVVTDVPPAGVSVGDTIQYTVQMDNKGLLPLGNTAVIDSPTTNLSYVPNSTTLNGNPVPDSVSGTPFPLDAPGYTIPVILRGGRSSFSFLATVVGGGGVTNVATVGGTTITAQNILVPSTNTSTISFTDGSGTPVASYPAGGSIFLTLTDSGANSSAGTVQTLSVVVVDATHGDFETVTLTETGPNTGLFRNTVGLPSSLSAGVSQQDGTVNVAGGDLLTVAFTDPIYGNNCNASAVVQTPSFAKVLYLSSLPATNSLNRVDPVAAGHINSVHSITLGGGTLGAVGIDGAASANGTNTGSLTFSYATGAGANRLMLVSVGTDQTRTVSSVTYNGVALTSVANGSDAGNTKPRVEVFRLVNPASGAHNLVVTLASVGSVFVGVNTFTNVDQTIPLGTAVATGNTSSATVNSSVNQLVYGTICGAQAETDAGGQTPRWTAAQGTIFGVGSTAPGASNVTMSWSPAGGSSKAGVVAVPILPVTTGGTTTTSFTQTPPFCQDFVLPAGSVVSITNFVSVISGTMPANPAIAAALNCGTNPVITLSSPVYNASSSNLVWTGSIPAAITNPAGQAFTYTLVSSEPGVTWNVSYDSVSAPSKIILPTTTVIHITSLEVFDAPYPAGNPVSAPLAGSTLYVRVSVIDPFGSYDISSANLAITGPTPGDNVNAALGSANAVADDGCSKTYEYIWQTGPTTGGYNVAVTANEGTEGITDTAATALTLTVQDLGTPSTTELTSGNNGPSTNAFPANSTVCIRVTDLDQNVSPTVAETVSATVTSSSGDSELVTLTETGTNTGVFTACIAASTSAGGATNNGVLLAPAGALLTASYTDPNDLSDSSSANATVLPPPGVPGVAVNKTLTSPANGQALVGDILQFNLQVVNSGSTVLSNITLTDNFPSGTFNFQSASLAPDTVTASSLIWTNLGSLAPGGTTNLAVSFLAVSPVLSATNSATATVGPTTGTGTATVTITQPALTVTKTVLSPTNGTGVIGSNVVFRIVVKNTGDTPVAVLPLEDTFSASYFQFVSAAIAPDGVGAGSLLWTNLARPGALAVNAAITNDIVMKVVGAGNPANNTATVDFAVDTDGHSVPASSSTASLTTGAAAISGSVYNDADQSGTLTPGDVGLAGVALQLFTDPNADGDPSDGALVQISSTDSSGYYEFLNLPTGSYVIVETVLPGFIGTAPPNNRLPLGISTLTTNANNNFFEYQPSPVVYATINGSVWNDVNGNGTNDLAELGIASVTIELVQDLNTNGLADLGEPAVASTTTDANGAYTFVNVSPGNYVVRETDLFGYYSTGDAKLPNDNQIPLALTAGVVTNSNDFFDRLAPIAVDDFSSAANRVPVTIAPLLNDISPNGDVLSIVNALTANGTVSNQGGTNVVFTATNLGTAVITYTIADAHGGQSSATISVLVTNIAPVANNDSYGLTKNTTLTISAPGVLANDTDADGDPLSAVLVSGPTHGVLSLSTDGSFTYTPVSNYFGADSFTYQASDGIASSAAAIVSLTVAATNRPPVANNDSYGLTKNTTLTISAPGVLANDTDLDGDPLTAAVVSFPAHGVLNLSTNGSFTYTPVSNYFGADSFTYQANDGIANSAAATVSLTVTNVNRAPVANNDSYGLTKNTPLTISAPGVLANDTDLDGDPLTAAVLSGPTHGVLSLSTNGSFTYTPVSNYFGADSFTYQANDGIANSAAATVSLTVTNVNRAPLANPDSYGLNKNTTLTISAPGVLANDTDLDGDPLTAAVVSPPTHGVLNLSTNGSFTYTPVSNYFGADSFTYQANDGIANSAAATVSLTVTNVNRAPVANNDTYGLNKNTTLTISAPGVLINDTDLDGDPLTAAVVSPPTHGVLNLSTNGSFTYTPVSNYFGADSFTYHANDGITNSAAATVSLTVTNVNRAPVANPDSYGLNKNTTLTISAPGVLANDTDLDGDPLTAAVVSGPTHGVLSLSTNGSFTYTPVSNYFGADSFTYQAIDSVTNSLAATVSLTVTNVNRAPVANNDSYGLNKNTTLTVSAPGVLFNDSDLDGDPLTAAVVSGPTHGVLNLSTNGSFTYTPVSNYFGADSFTYQAIDGVTNSLTATVSLTVTNVNRAPVANNDSYGLTKNTTLTISAPGVLLNDTDLDGDPLTAAVVSGPAHGVLNLSTNGSFTYTPVSNYFGADSFTYQANDGIANSAAATVSLTVAPTNRPPAANNDSYGLNKNATLTISAPGVLANDTDLDGDPLTAVVVGLPAHGVLNLSTNGSFTYTPVSNYFGADSFTYQANDGIANSAAATVSLTVTNVNRPPVANNDSYGLNKNTTLTTSAPGVLANDTDLDGDPLTAAVLSGPAHGVLNLSTNGSFTYTPVSNYFGADSFTYQANDGVTNSAAAIVSLTVTNVNRAPVAINDSYGLNKNTTLSISAPGVLANDTDLDGDPLTSAVLSGPAHGVLNLSTNGSFTYTPVSNYFGADSFTYQANDGITNSAAATVSLTVTNVNRAPVASPDSYGLNKNTTLTISAPGVLANDTDLDGDPLTAAVVSAPGHGVLSLSTNGSFTYTPVSNYFGADSFTYRANDGTANSAAATVSLTVTNVNRAPVANNESYGLNKNTTLSISAPGVLANDTDPDGDPLTAAVVSLPAHGVLNLTTNGSLTYTPVSNYFGADSFTYQANDGTANSAAATVSLTVTNVNRAPVANNDSYGLNKNTTLTISAPGVLANDTDLDGDPLTAAVVSLPAHGVLNLSTNGSLTYTPVSNYFGADSFTYRDNDGVTNSTAATVSLTITNVVNTITMNPITFTNSENFSLLVSFATLLTNGFDSGGAQITVVSVATNGTQGGRITSTGTNLTYMPATNFLGTDSFQYFVTDNTGASGTGVVFVVLVPPQFGIFAGTNVFNPQTGLFEQQVNVTNIGASTVAAVQLLVGGLRSGVTLYNAAGTNSGQPFVLYNAPLNPGQMVQFLLEFYVPDRRPFTDTLTAVEVPPTFSGTNAAGGVLVDRFFVDSRIPGSPRFVIEFTSIPGRTYTVFYRDGLTSAWQAATPSITANATRTQWYNDGPPKTSSKPLSSGTRLYMVLVAPTNP